MAWLRCTPTGIISSISSALALALMTMPLPSRIRIGIGKGCNQVVHNIYSCRFPLRCGREFSFLLVPWPDHSCK